MKVKIFSFQGAKILSNAETEINAWLTNHDPKYEIVEIKQSVGGGSWAPSNLVVSIWYREKTQSSLDNQ